MVVRCYQQEQGERQSDVGALCNILVGHLALHRQTEERNGQIRTDGMSKIKMMLGKWEFCFSVSYSGVEGEGDVLVVSSGSEGDLRQSEIVLGAGQGGVQHEHVALQKTKSQIGCTGHKLHKALI